MSAPSAGHGDDHQRGHGDAAATNDGRDATTGLDQSLVMDASLQPTDDDVTAGMLCGDVAAIPPVPHGGASPRLAIESLLAEQLRSGPTFVAFSGGRDSSALLAIACHVARREGLALPIPVTHRYPGDAAADEQHWQERVIAHLGVQDWWTVTIDREHELLGDVALRGLQRHGVRVPAGWWILRLPAATPTPTEPLRDSPDARAAGALGGAAVPGVCVGGDVVLPALVTGLGGDEVAWGSPLPLLWLVRHGRLRTLRRVRGLGREVRSVTPWRPVDVAGWEASLTWIRPEHRRRVAELRAREDARLPVRYDHGVLQLGVSRMMCSALDASRVGALERQARLVSPFLDPVVLGAFAARYGRWHPRSRAALLGELVGDLLPADVLRRETKAVGTRAFIGEESREFLGAWDGSGPADDVVDGDEVRRLLLLASDGDERGDMRPVLHAQRALLAHRG